jgi:gluconolactonase
MRSLRDLTEDEAMMPRSSWLSLIVLVVGTAACTGSDDEAGEAADGVELPEMAAAVFDTTSFEVANDEAFRELVPADAQVTRIAGDMQFVEGPVWREGDGGHLIFSDIQANELKRWDGTGGVSTFRAPSGPSNGNTLDAEGRLVTAQHDGRITRTEADSSVVSLVEEYMGDRLSSPNDVVVRSDGTIWFTDPSYGLGDREQETPGNYVYRFDPSTEQITAVITDAEQPNGLCFTPDESTLYLSDSGGSARNIRTFQVASDGTLSGGGVFATIDQGAPDGIRCDARGNVWSSAGDGVRIFAPGGQRIGTIVVPEAPTNLEFGGPDGRTLFITARTSLYSVPVLVGDGTRR